MIAIGKAIMGTHVICFAVVINNTDTIDGVVVVSVTGFSDFPNDIQLLVGSTSRIVGCNDQRSDAS